MIKDEQIIKVIAEATSNRYNPNDGPVTNTLGWRQHSDKVSSELNKTFGLSLSSVDIQNCPNITSILSLVKEKESEVSRKNFDFSTTIIEMVNKESFTFEAYRKIFDFSTTTQNEMINIVITGKSGAGKSSFLNYLIGKDHFEVGEGAPVTKDYFEDYTYQVPDTGVKYHLYDTKGIEPTTTEECRNIILNEIQKRDKLSLFEWIHTVYYCFDASAKRIQPFEIDFINELKKHVSIVILLTKKDLVNVVELNKLISQIKIEVDTNVQVIPVCSVEQRTRKGISHKEGKEIVLKASFFGLWEKLANSHPHRLIEPLAPEKPVQLLTYINFNVVNNDLSSKFSEIQKGKFSIDYLSNFPLYESLGDKFVVPLMEAANEYIKKLFNFKCLDVDYIWRQNEKIHQNIFNFYQKVNKERPRVLYSNIAKDAMRAIINYETEGKYDKLLTIVAKIRKLYQDVDDTWFSNADERIAVHNCFSEYRDMVMKIGIELNLLINKFLSSYHAELIQYGQYCIKKEVEEEEHNIIGSEGELNYKENTYYQVVMACLEDGTIGDSERSVLEKLVEVLGISTIKAGLIEHFARNRLKENGFNFGTQG